MNVQDVSLQAPHFICEAGENFCSENRKWQSAPSAAMTEKGRIFCVFSGDNVSADETVDKCILRFSDCAALYRFISDADLYGVDLGYKRT